ncbi:MAG TPA: DNA repair protein RecN [Myxococcales bacterium]|jgi:DNA repair protein RecN (Recombination protein N)|nr:DNA repair protein RecN [Myxococcales bacterium]
MLDTLRIRSFAIIDELEVRFESGFNVLTGETGAGKSILVDALHLALGGRAQADSVRTGAEEAEVEALFRPRDPALSDARLASLGLPAAGPELLVRRTVQREGRSRAFVNGALATAAQLAAATRGMLDISGQHEHVGLLDAAAHLDLLDAHAQLLPVRARYEEAFASLAEAERARAQLDSDESARAERADWLRYQLDEVEKTAPQPGEDEALSQERKLLASAEKLRGGAEESEELLRSGESAAAVAAGKAARRIEELAQIDPTLAPLAQSVRGAAAELDEAARALGKYAARKGGDPRRLEEVDERLELLRKLARKHGGTLQAALARAGAMQQELSGLENHGEELARREAEVRLRAAAAAQIGRELSDKRRGAAAGFSRAVAAELSELGMAKSELSVRFSAIAEGGIAFEPGPGDADSSGAAAPKGEAAVLGPRGLESAELLLSPNPGEELRPLARIASGGELSRVLLAVKRVLVETDPVDAYLFDEVDAGIGGATADAVGRALAAVARGRQVLCITHLPQIAAFAARHQVAEKEVARGRTQSRVALVEGEARLRELARLLSGHETEAALVHARELLEKAQRTQDGGARADEAKPKRARKTA